MFFLGPNSFLRRNSVGGCEGEREVDGMNERVVSVSRASEFKV